MKALIINSSSDYNLGCEKIANWLKRDGYDVTKAGVDVKNINKYDKIYLSAIYTWDIPAMIKLVQQIPAGTKVEIGGPAASAMADYIFLKTGIKPKIGLDTRFDSEPGKYFSTYTSRGCIRNCEFCSIPLVEGKTKEIQDFIPAPIILDPNFLACSKEHIINSCEKLSALPAVDFLHGLDARLLEPWHIELFINKLNLVCWRFTFDSLKNESFLKNVLTMLKNYEIKPAEKIIIYCIYGFSDTPEDAWERVNLITALNAHPYAMRYQPLDTLEKDSYIHKNWTNKKLLEFKQLCNTPTMQWLNNLLREARNTIAR
jgi:hypothetical protein